eukprot:ANDGO_04682.mRNA.1 Retrovirus-related Pol polyprotein from transposon TNT 1-94
MVAGLGTAHIEKEMSFCEVCLEGKQHAANVPRAADHSGVRDVLDLVHSNVVGPMSIATYSGYLYYVEFVDDYSWMIWVYALRAKSEVIVRFKEFKAMVGLRPGGRSRYSGQTTEGEYESEEKQASCTKGRLRTHRNKTEWQHAAMVR